MEKKNQEKINNANCKKCSFNLEGRCIQRNIPIEEAMKEPCIFFSKRKFSWKSFLLGGFSALILIKAFKKKEVK